MAGLRGWDMAGFEVSGWNRGGKVVFHMAVEAPNDVVAVLFAIGYLRRTSGAEAVIEAATVEARAIVRRGRAGNINAAQSKPSPPPPAPRSACAA